jgi:hypothetical protein
MAQPDRAPCAVVVSYTHAARCAPASHESVTRRGIAEKVAALHGYEYAGEYDDAGEYEGAVYFVPGDTLLLETAHGLGIRAENDLFGGVVPFPFVATKTITHPLVHPRAIAPLGWSREFARAVGDAVLPGYSAFSRADAIRGGERLLKQGRVRVKPALALGGRGQTVVADRQALERALAEIDPEELGLCGVVVEQNLEEDVTTYSVGQIRVAGLTATYFGTQKLATNHFGEQVYGGSDLTVARGDFAALLALDIEDEARYAIEQARTYDAAARRCFAGFFASRCNYDIVRGRDAKGHACCGVLEQSWRIGGASGAEIAALEAFHADPALRAARAECTELYDEKALPPDGATVYFHGIDPETGFITKYTTLEPYVDA